MIDISKLNNKIILGDCLNVMKHIPDNCIDLILADPPYGINLDLKWLSLLNMKQGKPKCKNHDKILNDDKTLNLSLIYSKAKKYVIFGFPYLQKENMTGWLIWNKYPFLEDSSKVIGNPVEMAFTNCWKGFDLVNCLWAGYYRDNNEIRYEHPTQKPLKVIQHIINKCTKPNDIILDPFAGSGTTGVACAKMNRRFICIEQEEKYYDMAKQRINYELQQKRLF